mgnify:CR=1 FL=1
MNWLMNTKEVSARLILYDLMKMPESLKVLLERDYEFNVFLRPFLECDWEAEYGNESPSIKQLSIKFGIKYDKLRKYLHQIYEVVIEELEDFFIDFKKKEYWLIVSSKRLKRGLCIVVKSMPIIPRVGEEVDFTFLGAYLDSLSTFYVEKICYEFKEDKQIVNIF